MTMTRMNSATMTICNIAVMGLAATIAASAQTGDPPILSTVPTPPLEAYADAGQMSGFPLQVGDLAPGEMTVRVIRRSFEENVVGQEVELLLVSSDGARRASTDAYGRAMFTGLPVGETVVARTLVDGETLESQPFALPSAGGVRLLLVANPTPAVSAWSVPPGYPAGALPQPAAATVPELDASSEPAWLLALPMMLGLATIGLTVKWVGITPFRRPRPGELTQQLSTTEDAKDTASP
jgi:hypothetical protein